MITPEPVTVALREVRAVTPPTAPVKEIAPIPADNTRDCDPSIVPPKKIAPLFTLVLMELDPVKIVGTTFVIVKEFAVMLLPIETLLVPAVDEIKMPPSLVVPPTTPVNVIAPLDPAFKVRACNPAAVPSIVPPKEIAPLFALVLIVVVPTKLNVVDTAFVIVKEFAVMLFAIETLLVPAVDEIKMAPSLVVPPRAPVNVIAPLDPAFKVRA